MDLGWLDVVLMVGLAARLIRLVTVDTIAQPAVERTIFEFERRSLDAGWWVRGLLECPFCIGFWLAGAVVASWAAWGHTTVWQGVAGWFTLSYVAGHLVAHLDIGPGDDD